jgi:hypothetical protein
VIANAPNCGECGNATVLVTGAIIYLHRPDLFALPFWRCEQCDAYVGCHPGTNEPLGSPANAKTRQARKAAHAAFDVLWRSGRMKRKEAYRWLCDKLGIEKNDCHIGMFNAAMCDHVVAVLKNEQHNV